MIHPPFIDYAQLAEVPNPVYLDVRWYLDGSDGKSSYLRGHLKSAIYVDLEATLTTKSRDKMLGRHPLPAAADFAIDVARLGVAAESTVVVMDDCFGTVAARLWWMLDALEVSAFILSGGVQSIPSSDMCTNDCKATPGNREPLTNYGWPDGVLATTSQLRDEPERFQLLDARARHRYLGLSEPIDRVAGHIPSAWSLPVLDLLADRTDYRRTDNLLDRLRASEKDLVAYCGSGVTACALIALLRQNGLAARLYPPSYSGWSSNPSNAICTSDCLD